MKIKKKIVIPAVLSAGSVAAAGGLSAYLASFVAHGKRQTLEEACEWQKSQYDLSFYEDLGKSDYTVDSYDGYTLHVQLCRNPAGGRKYVIISHGYTDNRYGAVKYMRTYLEAGYHCIIYDLRGHGLNEPDYCTYSVREAQDLYTLIQDTRARYGLDILLGLHGESLGGATTCAVLKYEQNLAFAVSDCGFADISNVLKVAMKRMHVPGFMLYPTSGMSRLLYGFTYREMQPVKAIEGNRVPVLFLHGEEDHFIVPDNSRRLQEKTAGYSELHLIPGAGHAKSVLTEPQLYDTYVKNFLSRVENGTLA
ncbi:MAG: alpha/beta fold hydrolase [Blautia sp.]|nr:alpha/beta fold hydrolase [Blautia sp.]